MAQLSVIEFLSKFNNRAPFGLYAMGDAGDDLRKVLTDLPKYWQQDCGMALFERDVALLLANESQLADIRSQVEGQYEFLDILKADAFTRFGVPRGTEIEHGLLIRERLREGESQSYTDEMDEMERRNSQLQDRRIRQLDRRIGDLEALTGKLRNEREDALEAWRTSGLGDRRSHPQDRRHRDGDRRGDAPRDTERRWNDS